MSSNMKRKIRWMFTVFEHTLSVLSSPSLRWPIIQELEIDVGKILMSLINFSEFQRRFSCLHSQTTIVDFCFYLF